MALTKVTGAGAEGLTLSSTDLKINSGDLIFSTADKGVVLGSTSNSAVNTISDYEEGTWTPSLNAFAGTPTFVSPVYTKIGRIVYANVRIVLDGTGDSDQFRVDGLPFTSADVLSTEGGFVTYSNSTETNIYVLVFQNDTSFGLYETSGGTVTYNEIGANKQIRISVIYRTS
jgi:hypothetical protein